MRVVVSLAIGMLAAFIFLACNSKDKTSNSPVAVANSNRGATATNPPGDGVRRITPAELRDLLANGQAVVVDVRNAGSYNLGHIKGAKLIPTGEFLGRVGELPRDKMVVTYCS